ncbi:hypothetical protein [Planococcus koreensis]|uniref:hypothetical protein n=1 Tax=Planococcus koreensis TaxID=112331 RepID=UPI0039FD3BF0
MKFYKYIELDDKIVHGTLENGHSFWEKEIRGWNDNETFIDMTSIVKIRAIDSQDEPETKINVDYSRSDMEEDLMIGKLVDRAKNELLTAGPAVQR